MHDFSMRLYPTFNDVLQIHGESALVLYLVQYQNAIKIINNSVPITAKIFHRVRQNMNYIYHAVLNFLTISPCVP